MTENLAHRGLGVTMVELTDQVMPSLDPEVAHPIAEHLKSKGVNLKLGEGVASFENRDDGKIVATTSGGAQVGWISPALPPLTPVCGRSVLKLSSGRLCTFNVLLLGVTTLSLRVAVLALTQLSCRSRATW